MASKIIFHFLIFLTFFVVLTQESQAQQDFCTNAEKIINDTKILIMSNSTNNNCINCAGGNTNNYAIFPATILKSITNHVEITRIRVVGVKYLLVNGSFSTPYFGIAHKLLYNNQVYGYCYYYGNEYGFDIFCAYNSDYYYLPPGVTLTTQYVSHWCYTNDERCYGSGAQIRSVAYDTSSFRSFTDTLLNNKIYVWSYSLASVSINYLPAYVEVFYNIRWTINYTYCCNSGYNFYYALILRSDKLTDYTFYALTPSLTLKYNINSSYIAYYWDIYPLLAVVKLSNISAPATTIDETATINCQPPIQITPPPPQGRAYLTVKSASNISINNYKIILNNTLINTDNGKVDVTQYIGKKLDLTVCPLYDNRLCENSSIVVNVGENLVILNNYYYAIQLRAFYKTPLGELKPISFTWLLNGTMMPDKTNPVGEIAYGGTAFGNTTIIVPAGVYNVSFKTNILGFEKSSSEQVQLLDNAYYRFLTFIATLTSSEIEQGSAISAILQVIIQDQNGNDVNNASVKLLTTDGLEIATLITQNGQAIFGGLELGKTYKVEVYVANNKKAEKIITMDSASKTVIITITLSQQEQQYLQNPPNQIGGSQAPQEQVVNVFSGLINNLAFWAFIIVCVLAVLSAQYAGERIALIVFVAGIGMLTYVVPMLPQAIFITIVVVAGILFSWKVVGKLADGGEE